MEGSWLRLGVGEFMTLDPMYCQPVFSPSERLVPCSPGTGEIWWTPPEEDWPDDFTLRKPRLPSLGGVVTFGWLLVHDIG